MKLSFYDQSWFKRGKNSLVVILWYFIQNTVFKLPVHNLYNYRNFILRMFGCNIGRGVKIRRNCEITYPWNVKIGDYSWIDDEVLIYSLDKIAIGSNCSISRRSYLCTGAHNESDKYFSLITNPVTIENGVWIQSDCFVAQGVKIGKNCVIRARSNVFKDMPNNMICGGSPCKPLKERVFNG